MKIALINAHNPKSGIGKYTYCLFKEFQKMNLDVTLFDTSYLGNEFGKRIKPLKFPFLRQTLNDVFYYPFKIPKGFDVYHITSQGSGAYLKHLKKNTVITVHDIIPFSMGSNMPYLMNLLSKKSISHVKKAGIILSDSHHTKKDLQKYLQIPENQVTVVPLAIDHNIFKPDGKRKFHSKEKIILHVGSEEERKNVDLLLKAFYKLIKVIPNVTLYRVGKRDPKIKELAKKLGLSDKIKYFSNISDEELAKIYNQADVLVFPSSYEGFGFPPLEAMACGCPTLSSDRTSVGEILGDGAIKINPLSIDKIYKELLIILTKLVITKKLSLAGTKQAKKFTWEKCAKETYEAYKKVSK